MVPTPLVDWLRLGLFAVVILAVAGAVLWCRSAGPRVVDARDLTAEAGAYLGSEVVVIGEWGHSGPYPNEGYMVVVLCGRNGVRVDCHFEDVPGTDRAMLENRLSLLRTVAVRGRCDGVEKGHVILRGCKLLD
jgi:hypothetical protein